MIVQGRFIAPTPMITPDISGIASFFIVKNVPAALSFLVSMTDRTGRV
jgi:hypothetical protein